MAVSGNGNKDRVNKPKKAGATNTLYRQNNTRSPKKPAKFVSPKPKSSGSVSRTSSSVSKPTGSKTKMSSGNSSRTSKPSF